MNNRRIKNEHIVWAYADRTDGAGQVLVVGLTDDGLAYLTGGRGPREKDPARQPARSRIRQRNAGRRVP
jgi:hypothetical protein